MADIVEFKSGDELREAKITSIRESNARAIKEFAAPILADILTEIVGGFSIVAGDFPVVFVYDDNLHVFTSRDFINLENHIDVKAQLVAKSRLTISIRHNRTYGVGITYDKMFEKMVKVINDESLVCNYPNLDRFLRTDRRTILVMMDEVYYLIFILHQLKLLGFKLQMFNVHLTIDGRAHKHITVMAYTDLHSFEFTLPYMLNLRTLDTLIGKYPNEYDKVITEIDNEVLSGDHFPFTTESK